MSITTEREWQIARNVAIATAGNAPDDYVAVLETLVVQLLAFSDGGVHVVGSSDGVSAAVDGTNRWTVGATLLWSGEGTPHAWIQIAFPGIAAGAQLLICLTDTADPNVRVSFSYAGFTGGTVSARPTAADEVLLAGAGEAGAQVFLGLGVSDFKAHVWLSSDGAAMRFLVYCASKLVGAWQFERVEDATTAWTQRAIGRVVAGAGTLDGGLLYADVFKPAGGFKARAAGVTIECGLTCEACGTSALGQLMTAPDGISGEYPIVATGLYSASTGVDAAPLAGRRGRIADLYLGSTTPTTGGLYPADASRLLIQIGDMVWPWDGSATFDIA